MRYVPSASWFLVVLLFMISTASHAADPVVLVCEHGSVKSLMAASMFNRAASERGAPFRAVSRGVTPDKEVPPKIAEALGHEGFDVRTFTPTRISSEDLSKATRVVTIGVDLPASVARSAASIDRWDDVPPASVDYAAAHEALKRHIERLLDELSAAH